MMMWTKNLRTPEEKERFENSLKGSKIVLDRLSQMLEEDEAEITRTELSIETYSMPNWAEKQAHKNGQRAAIRRVKQYLNLDQQKD